MSPAPELDPGAYLWRVGLESPLAPSLDALRSLHQAHLATIPFENLDIVLGRRICLDLGDLQAKLVAGGRGGYCFEHNTLFAAVLRALGFSVTPLAARVRSGGDPGVVRPRTHMLLRVDLPEGPFLADVGFGADGAVHPVPLVAGREHWLAGSGHRLRREAETWVLEGSRGDAWSDLYAFTEEPQHPVDYEMANHFTSTYPRSPFVLNLVAQRTWPERRLFLRNRELTERRASQTRTEEIRDPEHLLEVLAEGFGLVFPPGTRFAHPEFPGPVSPL